MKMKPKLEHCELTDIGEKLRRFTRSWRRMPILTTITERTQRKLRSSRTTITNLPPEILLEIFSWLSPSDVYRRVASVCMKWSILARHPFLRKELSFSGKDISTSTVRKIVRSTPLLRRLTLSGRCDSNLILEQVCKSNRRIETIEMEGCRGSSETHEVSGEILKRALEVCPKLCHLEIKDTLVKDCEFYRVLGRLDDRMKSFRILSATSEGILCYLETRAQVHQKQTAVLNKKKMRRVEDIKFLVSGNSDHAEWTLDLHD
jgi:hypothetical protein